MEIEFELEGIRDLKMDAWTDLPQPKNEEGYKKFAEFKVYRDEKGNISIPANAIKGAMRNASSEVGRKMEGKKNRQTIISAVFIEPVMLSLGKKTHDGIIRDIVTKTTSKSISRFPIYRPLIKRGWKIKGKMISFGVPFDFLKEVLELAGLRYGLLAQRGEFGLFQVNNFKEVK